MKMGAAMADLLAQLVELFGTPLGRGVLATAVLSIIGLLFYAFWDVVRMPRRDNLTDETFQTAPPPVMTPKMVTRKGDSGFSEDRSPWFRHGVMVAIAVMFGLVLLTSMQSSQKLQRREAVLETTTPVAMETYVRRVAIDDLTGTVLQTASLPQASSVQRHSHGASFCEPAGSLYDRSVEVCEAGASVRMDLMRLSASQTFAVKPTWDDTAPTFVRSQSHAAPFGFAADVGFAAPETVVSTEYDGYLVIGVSEAGQEIQALKRAEALRGFAIRQLSGGDRAQCLTEERVYTTTATFDRSSVAALTEQRAAVADLARRARGGNADDRAALAQAQSDLAQAELLYAERPAPLVIGIKADPVSSDTDADMQRASEAFLKAYGPALQLTEVGPINALRVCARGEVSR